MRIGHRQDPSRSAPPPIRVIKQAIGTGRFDRQCSHPTAPTLRIGREALGAFVFWSEGRSRRPHENLEC
jgi:hypothetical protein